MPWYHSYTSHSWGHGHKAYHYFASKKDFEEFSKEYSEDMNNHYSFSDKYHGVVFKKVNKPPKKWLRERLYEYQSRLESFDKEMANKKLAIEEKIKFYNRQLS